MGKNAGFLTGLVIGGTDAFIKHKAEEKANKRQDARDALLRAAIGPKALAASPLGMVGDELLDKTKKGDDAPGFAGTQDAAPIAEAKIKPLNAIEQANADQAEMADEFKNLTGGA